MSRWSSLRDMVFNSIVFLLYLPIVFLLYWFVFRNYKAQNAFVVIASYIFYGWWDWRFLILIAFTSICSYLCGLGIKKFSDIRKRKPILCANIAVNLGILATFKYFNFFIDNLRALLHPLGIQLDIVTVNLILPVGISFYTFQALSYTIDVYRNKIEATRDPIAFFAFISFFPQLVAGPIERATNLLPYFLKPRIFDYNLATDGCRQILWGLFKKMVVADNCAKIANSIFASYDELGGLNLWIGALCFTFQIYGDFSGYSDIAIGTAKLFGIKLMRNFNRPYFSRSIAEFWRRWHISLNTWFVDYVYIPLGGSRCGKYKKLRNTFAIFLLSGLWHGAEWTFVLWGAYNAVLFIPSLLTGSNRKHIDTVAADRLLPSVNETLLMASTFFLVMIGWVLFRADNISHAIHYIAIMFSDLRYVPVNIYSNKSLLLFIAFMLTIEWLQRNRQHTAELPEKSILRYKPIRWAAYYTLAMATITLYGQQSDFIYFQF